MPDQPIPGRSITDALLTAIAHSTEPMALSDPHRPDHPIIAVNPAFEAMTGYPAAEIVGRNCRMLQGPGTDLETARKLGRVIAAGEGCVEWIVNHRKGGAAFWNLLFISPVRDGQGRIIHYFANQHDITQGLPARLSEVNFGRAHMPAEIVAEFQRLVHEIAAAAGDGPGHARELEKVVAAARRLAEVSTTLAPGPA
ncbi:MAG TPA: PAS domain-containing protein [Acetobacteraceae bacterium]